MRKSLSTFLYTYVFVPAQTAHGHCPDCHKDLKVDARFCDECGSTRKQVMVQRNFFSIGHEVPQLRTSFLYILFHVAFYFLLAYAFIGDQVRVITRMETYDWFFSTVTQSYIALIALLVAVVTFRLQSNHKERIDLGRRIQEQLRYFIADGADCLSVDDAIEFGKHIHEKEYEDTARVTRVSGLVTRITYIEKSSRSMRDSLKITFWASATAALSALFFLVSISHLYIYYLETVAVVFVLEAVVIATSFTWQLVKSLR